MAGKILRRGRPLQRKLAESAAVNRIGGLGIAYGTVRWMRTLGYRAAYHERCVDPAHPDFEGPAIFLFWHEYIPFLFYLRGHCNISMLLSTHQDAEWLSQAARYMGFDTVRGSTTRGGVRALRELVTKGRTKNLAITPDGPRGPRRKLAPGPIYLASRLQIPLVAIGLGYQNPWRLSTWDQFAVPRPYSRARAISSPFIHVPAKLGKDGIEQYRGYVETMLCELTEAAEHWAAGGYHLEGEEVARPQSPKQARFDPTAPSSTSPPGLRVADFTRAA